VTKSTSDQWTKEMTSLSFHHFLFQLVLIWAAMADLLVFSAIVSSFPSFVAGLPSSFLILVGTDLGGHGKPFGLFGHCLIFSVICCCSWCRRRSSCDGVRCGPLGNSPWTTGRCGGPAFFIFSCFWLVLPQTIFFGTILLICWLMKKTNLLL
jgi:hypothetical protein